MSAHLDSLKNSIQDLQKAWNDDDRKLKTSKDAVVSQIKQLRKDINHRLDELESSTMKKADTTFQFITDNIQVRLKQSQALMNEIKATQNSLNAVAANQAQLFVSMKQASDVLSRATEIVQTASGRTFLPDISFLADQKLQILLQEMKVLGSTVVTEAGQSVHPQQQTSFPGKTHPTQQSAPTQVTKPAGESQHKTPRQTSFPGETHPTKQPAPTQVTKPAGESQHKTPRQTSFPGEKHPAKLSAPTQVTKPAGESQHKTPRQTSFPGEKHPAKQSAPTQVTKATVESQLKTHQQTSFSGKTHPAKQFAPTQVTKATIESQLRTHQQMPSLLQVQKPKSYPVKLSSDTNTCRIPSACVLDDGTVILADYNNNKLKCLDRSTYRVRDNCDVPKYPWQVCVISQQEMAVSCDYSKLIQFVSFGSTMCCTRQIHTDFECYGLACADGKLYVSDKDTSVYVYTVSGKRLQQLRPVSGQSLFSDIYSLAVSSDNSRIYVADWDNRLIILDTSGKLVSQYNDPQLGGARGVCLYKDDSVLVCGSKNVLQFTADGQLVGEVLKTDESSQALCWDEKNSRLIVGYFEEHYIDMFVIK